jgi:hypothetical protein
MQVQVETDNHVEGREKLIEPRRRRPREDQKTHVEAHLGDANQPWSWNRADGRDVLHLFGPLSSTAEGSGAAQLWSRAYIAVRPQRESTP